jgi:heptosyltransferase-2
MSAPRAILVRAPNWMGDLIMATPGLRALRAGHPNAHIALHARAGLLPLVAGAPWCDEALPVRSYGQGPAALLAEARALRRRRFDLGVCLPDSFSSALLMRAAGVRRVVGYRRGWRRALLHQAEALPRGAGRRVMIAREEHVLGLCLAAGGVPQGTHLELFVTPDDAREGGEALAKAGVSEGATYAVLAPGASFGSSKLWPAESFARVGDALARAGAQVVVIGTPDERALAERVVRAMGGRAANLAGAVGLGGLKHVMRGARVLVCNDAGARHLGVAFGVPSVVLMGPTALEKTSWNLERVSVFTADVPCRPCYLRECPIDHRCMTRIPAERVAAEALPALEGAGRDAFRGRQVTVRGEGEA